MGLCFCFLPQPVLLESLITPFSKSYCLIDKETKALKCEWLGQGCISWKWQNHEYNQYIMDVFQYINVAHWLTPIYMPLTLVYFTNIILGQKVFYIPQIISCFLHIIPDRRLDMCFGHLCPTAHILPLKVLLIQVRNLLRFKIAEDPNWYGKVLPSESS